MRLVLVFLVLGAFAVAAAVACSSEPLPTASAGAEGGAGGAPIPSARAGASTGGVSAGGAGGAAANGECPSADAAWAKVADQVCQDAAHGDLLCTKQPQCETGADYRVEETIDCTFEPSWHAETLPCPPSGAPTLGKDGCPLARWASANGQACGDDRRCHKLGECVARAGFVVDESLSCANGEWRWTGDAVKCNDKQISLGADGCPLGMWADADEAVCENEGTFCDPGCTPGEYYTDEQIYCHDGRWRYESLEDSFCEGTGGASGAGGSPCAQQP